MTQNPEALSNPADVAEQQRVLGNEWAEIFEATALNDREIIKSAEITLRNPVVYLQDVSPLTMSPELQDRWTELLADADNVVERAETTVSDWGEDTNGIAKLQHRLFSGELNPAYGRDVARIIGKASDLFADSSVMKSGNTQYYAGNIKGMQSWIRQYRTED